MFDLITRWWCKGWARCAQSRATQEKGSVTMENVIWALAVIGLAAIVFFAIRAYVTSESSLIATPDGGW